MRTEKWIQSAIEALIDTAIITMFTGRWSWFLFLWITSIPPKRVISYYLFERKAEQNEKAESRQARVKPFAVSEYCTRMEEAVLDILEDQEPVDQTIILWWGLDGLRLNEDGSLEWISRKKPKPVNQNVFYQPCQSAQSVPQPNWCNQTQSAEAQIAELMAKNRDLQIRAELNAQNAAIISQLQPPMSGHLRYSPYMQSALASPLQQCCVQYPVQYPSYYYRGCCRLN